MESLANTVRMLLVLEVGVELNAALETVPVNFTNHGNMFVSRM